MRLETRFREAFTDSIELKRRVLEELGPLVVAAAEMLAQVFKAGGKVLIFGNGGSAADAQHLAGVRQPVPGGAAAPGRPGPDHRYLDPHRGGQ